jgi:hypothetical protein
LLLHTLDGFQLLQPIQIPTEILELSSEVLVAGGINASFDAEDDALFPEP